jgi:uncharacterized protein
MPLLCPVCPTTAASLGRAMRNRIGLLATGGVIASLGVLNVVKHVSPSAGVGLGVGAAAALLLAARAAGLSLGQPGLSRERLRAGLLWGGGSILAVGAVYLAGLLLPATRGAFLDARYQLEVSDALKTAFVVIPLSTVLLEEVAFRSVLWGMLKRHMGTTRVVLVTSALFGLWHILPALDFAAARGAGQGSASPTATAAVVLGTVAFTAAGGAVAGELRRRSGSVVASAGLHWATNALGVLFGLVAWHIVSR